MWVEVVVAMWGALGTVITAGVGAAVGIRCFWAIQGDCNLVVEGAHPDSIGTFMQGDRLRIHIPLQVTNEGRQKGMLVEVLPRAEYIDELQAHLVVAWTVNATDGRQDGYWNATHIAPNQQVKLDLVCDVFGSPAYLRRLLRRSDFPIVVHCKNIGRTGIYWSVFELDVPLAVERAPRGSEHEDHPRSHENLNRKG